MIDQQLYIDGVLMDLSEDTNITLDIKSNLFRDISKMETNNTYTIELPKTTHNMASVDWAAKPKTGSKYPYVFHKARYFRNGVEVIKDGRASLLSVEDNIEIAIYWGLFPAFSSLQESDMKLSDLQTTKYLRFERKNSPAEYDKALEDGVFYADYDQTQVKPSSEDWSGYDITEGKNKESTYTLTEGKIKTGTAAGAHVSGSIEEDSACRCCIVPFVAGETASINEIISSGDYRTYAIIDKNMNVVSLADDSGKASLIFDLDLQKVFDEELASYRKMIAGARVITEYLRLSDIEILDFDETKPVYLAQYGAYFAVLEIKTTNSGYCEVEMIELIN